MSLKDQNNPQVLAAITDVVKKSSAVSLQETQATNNTLALRYAGFRPVQEQLQEGLSPKQKKIAKVAGNPAKIDSADFKALRAGKKVEENTKERKTLAQIIDEGRGRPRKNPLPATAPTTKTAGEEDDGEDLAPDSGKEPDQHIHVQLKKAADSAHHEVKAGKDGFKTKGGADVKFDEGTHFVQAEHAKKVLDAVNRLKPADRDKMHAHIAQSHANFMAVHKLVS